MFKSLEALRLGSSLNLAVMCCMCYQRAPMFVPRHLASVGQTSFSAVKNWSNDGIAWDATPWAHDICLWGIHFVKPSPNPSPPLVKPWLNHDHVLFSMCHLSSTNPTVLRSVLQWEPSRYSPFHTP